MVGDENHVAVAGVVGRASRMTGVEIRGGLPLAGQDAAATGVGVDGRLRPREAGGGVAEPATRVSWRTTTPG
jgi:hypothetical protein